MAITQSKLFQHTAARRRLPEAVSLLKRKGIVSTHSRAEAAAYTTNKIKHRIASFNTQPPEGGCRIKSDSRAVLPVSTHSRPKAAAQEKRGKGDRT